MSYPIESGYYPAGAEFDPRAPYNQPEPQTHIFRATVELTLIDGTKKSVTQEVTIEYFDEETSKEEIETMIVDAMNFGDEFWDDYELTECEEL